MRALALLHKGSKILDELFKGDSAIDTSRLETVKLLHSAECTLDLFNTGSETLDATKVINKKNKTINQEHIRSIWCAVLDSSFDCDERFVSVVWILGEESVEHLEVAGSHVHCIEFGWKYCQRWGLNFTLDYAPLFRNILAPAGRASTPALMASKACSSGTGVGVQLEMCEQGVTYRSKLLPDTYVIIIKPC